MLPMNPHKVSQSVDKHHADHGRKKRDKLTQLVFFCILFHNHRQSSRASGYGETLINPLL